MPYLRKRRGAGAYSEIGDWSWLYYPREYAFASRARRPAMPGYYEYAPARYMGLGCAGSGDDCGCGCKGTGDTTAPIDWSPTSTSLGDKIQTLLPVSSSISIPNWLFYVGAGLLVLSAGRRGR